MTLDEQNQDQITQPAAQGNAPTGPAEQQAVTTTNTPSPQADQNNPQPVGKDDDGNTPEPQGSGQQPQNVSQGAQQGSDNTQGQQGPNNAAKSLSDPGNAPANQPPPAEVHPAVQKANVIRDIAETLGGGPRITYAIDPNTGKMTRTKEPLSTTQIGMAIALAALTGGVTGLAQRGPGAEGRAAAAGFGAVQQQQQEQTAQQQQEASQNYARQAAIAQTNFQTHQNALRLSQMELDYHKQFVDTAAPILKNINAVGAAQASGVRESDLTNKYHVTKDLAIPDGTVRNGKNPDGSDHYENTYTVIDPNKKIALPDETAKLLADLRVPGYFTMKDGNAVPTDFAGSAGIKAGLVVNGLALAQSFQITEAQMNRQLSKYGDPEAAEQFDVNLKRAIADGTVSQKTLQTLAGYTNMAPDLAVAAMEKDKVDSGTIQAYRKMIPQEVMDSSKMARESAEARRKAVDAAKNLVITPKNAMEVLADKSGLYTDAQRATAQQVQRMQDQHDVSMDARKAAAGESARLNTEIAIKKREGIPLFKGSGSGDDGPLLDEHLNSLVQDPNNYKTANGTNEKFLTALNQSDPGLASIVKSYSQGMDIQSYYAAVKRFGAKINAAIHAYDPTFNASDMRRYDKTVQEWGSSGRMGRTNAAGATAIQHLKQLYDSYGVASASGMSAGYKTSLNNAAVETANYYANGNKPGKEEIEHTYNSLDHPVNQFVGRRAAAKTATQMMDKIESSYDQYDKDLPRGIKREPPLSPQAAADYKAMTGQDVDPRLINHNFGKGLQRSHDSSTGNVVPAGMIPGRDASGNIIGYKDPNTGQVTQF